MSRILSVQDNMAIKAANESTNMVGRYIQQLGLENLIGGTAASIALSGPLAIAGGLAVSPLVLVRNAIGRNPR